MSTKINVKGLQVLACHGVHEQEKVQPQPFVFDVEAEVDFWQGAMDDDLNKTVSYSAMANTIVDFATQNTFDLIEALAYRTALLLMNTYTRVQAITLTVSKPQAPIRHTFQNVSVTIVLQRERVLLSLGSSMGDKQATLQTAIQMLDGLDGVTVKKVSPFLVNEPYGGVAQNTFVNCAVEVECLVPAQTLLDHIHAIEHALGRKRDVHWGDRTIDIDIVFFGKQIICTDTLIVPHADYRNRDFVLIPLKQIAPDFVCPDCNKTIGSL